jgi:hypothetical protein
MLDRVAPPILPQSRTWAKDLVKVVIYNEWRKLDRQKCTASRLGFSVAHSVAILWQLNSQSGNDAEVQSCQA